VDAPAGSPVLVTYRSREPGETAERSWVAMVKYDPYRNWVIGSSMEEAELNEIQQKLSESMARVLGTVAETSAEVKRSVWWAAGGALGLLLSPPSLGPGWVVAFAVRFPKRSESSNWWPPEISARTLDASARDETGRMAESLNLALESLAQALGAIGVHAGSVAGSADELTAVSESLGASAAQTSGQAGVAAAACEQVSTNLGTIAGGAEEMSASIGELARNASEAAKVTDGAVSVTAGRE